MVMARFVASSRKIKKGILGGTFNPVHLGHLHLAQVAMRSLELDQLLFIPSCSPPHKLTLDLCPFQHRLAMLEVATAPYSEYIVSGIEGQRDGFSYTIDTLRQLHAVKGKNEELVFLMGFDAFQEMATWKEYLRIPDYASIAVCERDGYDVAGVAHILFGDLAARVENFTVPEKKVSSSLVRQVLKEKRPEAEAFLPSDVYAYIEKYNLFM